MNNRDYPLIVKILFIFWSISSSIQLLKSIFLILNPLFSFSTSSIVISTTCSIAYILSLILILNKRFLGIALFYFFALVELVSCIIDSSLGFFATPILRVLIISALLLIRKNRTSGWSILLHDFRRIRKKYRNKEKKAFNEKLGKNIKESFGEKDSMLEEDCTIKQVDLRICNSNTNEEQSHLLEEQIQGMPPKAVSNSVVDSLQSDEHKFTTEQEHIINNPPEDTVQLSSSISVRDTNDMLLSNKKGRLLIGIIVLLSLLLLGSVCYTLSNNKSRGTTESTVSKSLGSMNWNLLTGADLTSNKRKLYETLSDEYDLGSFENFCSKLEIEDNRRYLYETLSKDYNMGVYDYFLAHLGYKNPDRWSIISDSHHWYKMRYGEDAGTIKDFADELFSDSKAIKDIFDDIKAYGDLDKDWTLDEYKYVFHDDYRDFLNFNNREIHDYVRRAYDLYRERYGEAANTYELFSQRIAEEEAFRKILFDDLKKYGNLDETWDYEVFTKIIKDEYYYLIRPSRNIIKKTPLTPNDYITNRFEDNTDNTIAANTNTTKKDPIVFISPSKGAYAYHKKADCERLQYSRTITKVPLSEALMLKREPCSVCYRQSFVEKNLWIIIVSIFLLISIIINVLLWVRHKKQ